MRTRHVNWKNVTDNYSDGMHITVAHPGLTRLFGQSYGVEAQPWADKMWGYLRDIPSSQLSERMYQALLPTSPHLPEDRQRLWTYFKLWPNVAFDIYPDQIDFMQMIPISPTETLIREIAYAHPDQRREMRAARYLNWRINRRVSLEDKALIERVQAGMGSRSYSAGTAGQQRGRFAQFCAPHARTHSGEPPGSRAEPRLAHAGTRKRRELSSQPRDAVIVGGGHNGLVCAAYLAAAGLKVTVLERPRRGRAARRSPRNFIRVFAIRSPPTPCRCSIRRSSATWICRAMACASSSADWPIFCRSTQPAT